LKVTVSPALSITQGVPRGGCPGGFTRFLCSEKNWRIIQPMKARSDDDPASQGEIGRWYRQPRQLYWMLKLRIIHCLAM